MLWLEHHRVKVVIAIGLLIALPATIKKVRDTTACRAEIRDTGWGERFMVFAHMRPHPSGAP